MYITTYEDSACTVPIDGSLASSSMERCYGLFASSGVGSKSADPPIFHPGACAPTGGEISGTAVPVEPFTFCCLP